MTHFTKQNKTLSVKKKKMFLVLAIKNAKSKKLKQTNVVLLNTLQKTAYFPHVKDRYLKKAKTENE